MRWPVLLGGTDLSWQRGVAAHGLMELLRQKRRRRTELAFEVRGAGAVLANSGGAPTEAIVRAHEVTMRLLAQIVHRQDVAGVLLEGGVVASSGGVVAQRGQRGEVTLR